MASKCGASSEAVVRPSTRSSIAVATGGSTRPRPPACASRGRAPGARALRHRKPTASATSKEPISCATWIRRPAIGAENQGRHAHPGDLHQRRPRRARSRVSPSGATSATGVRMRRRCRGNYSPAGGTACTGREPDATRRGPGAPPAHASAGSSEQPTRCASSASPSTPRLSSSSSAEMAPRANPQSTLLYVARASQAGSGCRGQRPRAVRRSHRSSGGVHSRSGNAAREWSELSTR